MDSSVEQIKARLDIVAFIQSYIKLQKAGANFKALCPFHSEKTPSFMVSPVRGTWHCFGCGRHGDQFTFLMELEHLEFPEALRVLADRAGVEIKREDPALRSKRVRLLRLLDDATAFYELELKKSESVIAYLKQRGVEGKTAKQFRVGFAPDGWRNALAYLMEKGYQPSEMEEVGLVVKKQYSVGDNANANTDQRKNQRESASAYYDRFRNRIMFPLADSAGRVIGFSGRIFQEAGAGDQKPVDGEQAGAKYVNSPQTVFFDKSHFLYNFDKARQEMRKADTAVLVEGQMDAILSYQAGVKNVVAVSGTALTAAHLHMVKRFTERVVFAFDMDEAGIEAARKAVELGASEGLSTALIELPLGTDPADLASADPKKWQEAVQNAKESVAFFLARAIEKYSLKGAVSKRNIGKDVLPLIARIQNAMERAHWVGELARRLSLPEEACWKELAVQETGTRAGGASSAAEGGKIGNEVHSHEEMERKALLEQRILGLLLWKPGLLTKGLELPHAQECVISDIGRIFDVLRANKDACPNQENLLQQMDTALCQYAEKALFEVERISDLVQDAELELKVCLASWRAEYAREKMRALEITLRATSDENEETRILKEIQKLSTREE